MILTAESSAEEVSRSAGGKARNLHVLSRAGVPVPRWAVVPFQGIDRWVEHTGLQRQLSQLLETLSAESVHEVAAAISRAIVATELTQELRDVIAHAYSHVGASHVAVRSSAIMEDTATQSFAGQYDTHLNLASLESVFTATRKCFASMFSARALHYRSSRNLPITCSGMSVLIQQMVCADKSGVIFTINPMNHRKDELVISSAFGLGEGLVSGEVDADTVILERPSGRVLSTTLGQKEEYLYASRTGEGTAREKNSRERQSSAVLNEAELKMLFAAASGIEDVFGGAQDIEWSIAGDQVHILQSRPITTTAAAPAAATQGTIWDNSNIIESYNGATCPLTFSFARHVYHEVYSEYCRLLGVPHRSLSGMDEWLYYMLGYHNGHVYYNLLNWYRMLKLVPFFNLNKEVLDLTLGTTESVKAQEANAVDPLASTPRWQQLLIRPLSAVLFAYHFLTIDKTVGRFVKVFARAHTAYGDIDYAKLGAEEIYQRFKDLKRDLLRRWGRMILLEQTIAFSVGALGILKSRWLPQMTEREFFELTMPIDGLESMKPVHAMHSLAKQVSEDEELKRWLVAVDPAVAFSSLSSKNRESFASFKDRVNQYIRDFGCRSANELKLEDPDMQESPAIFFQQLKASLGVASAHAGASKPQNSAIDTLPLWKRVCFRIVQRKVQRTIAMRERVRFCRTQAFALTRRMMRAMGKNLQARGLLESGGDILYLRLEEIDGWLRGGYAHPELQALIRVRRELHVSYGEMKAPSRFRIDGFQSRDSYHLQGWSTSGASSPAVVGGQQLKGTPCCAGVVEGEAAVVESPIDVQGRILVAYRTDPGWCTALPTASALLIERGSPLTHVAIVARELGIPTVVQVKDLTARVRSGMRLQVNGGDGSVAILAGTTQAR